MDTGIVAALLIALVWKFVDFLKQARAQDWSAVTTQVIVWLSGFVAITLFAHSAFAAHAVVNGIRLAQASWVDQLLLGLMIGSSGSAVYDLKRALDRSDSAAMPPLLPQASATPPRAR